MPPNPSSDPLTQGERYAIEWIKMVKEKRIQQEVKSAKQINMSFRSESPTDRHLFGVLAWPSQQNVCDRYLAELPTMLPELFEWTKQLSISMKQALKAYKRKNLQLFGGIPVIVAVPRPAKLIGTESNMELLNFVIVSAESPLLDGRIWNNDATVRNMQHRTPLTTQKAQEISHSNDQRLKKMIVVGCGAVGSKIVMHLARTGMTQMTLVDGDELSPHNLVRHALLSTSVGLNKALALSNEIQSIFNRENVAPKTLQGNGIELLLGEQRKLLKQHNWLLDATASSSFLSAVIDTTLPNGLRVARAELADSGNMGLMSIEGRNRNPRLDDIRVFLFDLACENAQLSRWLQAERLQSNNDATLEQIDVGIGCHSDTMRLPDDVISYHSSLFSIGIKRIAKRFAKGILQISQLQQGDSYCESISIPSFTIFNACQNNSWQIRLKGGLQEELIHDVNQAAPNEIGGILIGRVNHNRKTIHVTRALPPSPDSKSSPFMFVRGIQDVLDSVRQTETATGDLLTYVGEWHSHPSGGGQLSNQDKQTVDKLRLTLDPVGFPTHIMIVTKREIFSHIFVGESA
jgi:proteasome lid subunit RPN8/RPN11